MIQSPTALMALHQSHDNLLTENERLTQRVKVLETEMGARTEFPAWLNITQTQRLMLGLLLKRESVSAEAFGLFIKEGAHTSTVNVHLHRLRKWLVEAYGVAIHHKQQCGWWLLPQDKKLILDSFNGGQNGNGTF